MSMECPGVSIPVSLRVVWVRMAFVTGWAVFPSRPSTGISSERVYAVVWVANGSRSTALMICDPRTLSMLMGVDPYISSPLWMRARVLGARGAHVSVFVFLSVNLRSGLSPIRCPRRVQSIAVEAGSHAGSMIRFLQDCFGQRQLYCALYLTHRSGFLKTCMARTTSPHDGQ